MSQNIYDNNFFFSAYTKLRNNQNSANILEEKPELFALLPDLKGMKVLDLGCGYGENLKTFADMGASYVRGIDLSKNMLEVAKKTCAGYCNIELDRLDMAELDKVIGVFDVVVSSLAMHYVNDFKKLCFDVRRLLNPAGIFVFSQEHPMFTATKTGVTWQTDIDNRVKGMVVENYPDSGKRETIWLGEKVVKYHRTTSEIINTLISAGFTIQWIAEPTVSDKIIEKNPDLARCKQVPDYLLVRASVG